MKKLGHRFLGDPMELLGGAAGGGGGNKIVIAPY